MTVLGWILGATALGSAVAVLLAALFLLLPVGSRERLLPGLLAYATGTLLAASLLELLPEAIERQGSEATMGIVLGGILLFFFLERFLLWRHCHERNCAKHGPRGPLILLGDALHNFADGAVIAAAFLVDVPLGVSTALAVFAHEIPQELGDFGILLSAGYSRGKALAANLISAASALLGAALGGLLLTRLEPVIPVVISLSAASFLYLGLADLLPALHEMRDRRRSLVQLFLLAAGIATVLLLSGGEGHRREWPGAASIQGARSL